MLNIVEARVQEFLNGGTNLEQFLRLLADIARRATETRDRAPQGSEAWEEAQYRLFLLESLMDHGVHEFLAMGRKVDEEAEYF